MGSPSHISTPGLDATLDPGNDTGHTTSFLQDAPGAPRGAALVAAIALGNAS